MTIPNSKVAVLNPDGSLQLSWRLWAQQLASTEGPTTVAGLSGNLDGQTGFVTDSTVPALGNFGAVVVGGGSNHVPVYYETATPAWRIG